MKIKLNEKEWLHMRKRQYVLGDIFHWYASIQCQIAGIKSTGALVFKWPALLIFPYSMQH